MFKSQRINDQVYIESGDGRIKLVYPYKAGAQVKGLIDAAELMLPENDPQLQLGVPIHGADAAVAGFEQIRKIAKIPTPAEKKPKKHREAKALTDSEGVPFKIGEMIEARLKSAKGHKLLLRDMVDELKVHYVDDKGVPNEHHAKNAIRISALKSMRFSLAGDYIIPRVAKAAS